MKFKHPMPFVIFIFPLFLFFFFLQILVIIKPTMTMRWRAEGEMKWVWQDDWGPACRPHTSNFLVISFPCNFSIFIYWSHHISARFSSTKSNLKQMLMLQNDCRTTHIQLLSFVICSSYKSQHTSLNCESWNMSIAVKVEIFLSLWKGPANADSAMTSTFSNNAWKNVICLWMVTQSHRSTNTTQYLTTGMNISMFSKQILVSTLVCCSIWEFTENYTF